MEIEAVIRDVSAKWSRQPAAPAESLATLRDSSELRLPDEYLAFLAISNGGEGELSVEPGWFQIWSASDVVELNRSYEVTRNVSGFFGFGSNGGGELLAFDTRHGDPWRVVMIPFIPMDKSEAVEIAPDFMNFVTFLGKSVDTKCQSN